MSFLTTFAPKSFSSKSFRYNALLVQGVLCLYFIFDVVRSPAVAAERYAVHTYLIFSILCLVWLWHLILFIVHKRRFISAHRKEILCCLVSSLLLTSVVFHNSPQRLRIFDDAPDRLSASISFDQYHRCERLHEGHWNADGTFKKLSSSRVARSPFFPYLLSLVHSVFGYRLNNVFFLNWLVLNTILAMVSLAVLFRFGKMAALCVQLILLSQPLLLYVTESACYEGLMALPLMVMLFTAYRIISNGASTHSVSLLLLGGATAIHCRPETIVLAAAMIVLVMVLAKTWVVSKASVISISASFLSVMPYFWHRVSFGWSYPTMDIPSKGSFGVAAPTASKFTENAFSSFMKPFSTSVHAFFDFSDKSAFNGFLTYGFVFFALWFVFFLAAKKLNISSKHLFAVVPAIVCIIGHICLISYVGWAADHPNTTRYFILVPIGISTAVIWILFTLFQKPREKIIILIFSIGMFFCFLPNIVSPVYFEKTIVTSSYYQFATDYLKPVMTNKSLVVSENPTRFLINKWNSVGLQQLNARPHVALESLKSGRYDNVYIVQQMDKKFKRVWDSSESINEKIQTRVIFKKVTGNKTGVQVSKVIL